MSDLRPSPIAGTWYPGDAEALARSVDLQLAEVELEPAAGPVVGLIAPHAGHRYSGGVAAHAFRAVAGIPGPGNGGWTEVAHPCSGEGTGPL